jgi:hypothetical protein
LDETVVAADVPERAGSGGEQEALRQRHVAEFEAMLSGYAARIDWPEDLVRAERLRALRVLLATAARRSPWHRERLAGFDLEAFCEADIASLPVMTKTDLMDNLDSIVTDRRVTRELCERHLHELTGDGYLLGEYHVVASGGSSGQRECSSTGGTHGRSAGRRWSGSPNGTGLAIGCWRAFPGLRRW